MRVWYDGSHPALSEALKRHPHLVGVATRPYISGAWDARQKLAAVEEHYRLAVGRGRVLVAAARAPLRLATIAARDLAVDIVIDSPAWFMHEGQVSINLFLEDQRLYSLAFSLGRDAGEPVAYVGAIQGCGTDGTLEIYRRLTRALHGLRPRDLLMAAFRTLCAELEVARILAVSDRCRVCDSAYFRDGRKVASSYDAAWTEYLGVAREDGFFQLPTTVERRSPESISSQKRAEYRKRYEMLDQLGVEMAHSVRFGEHAWRLQPRPEAVPSFGDTVLPVSVAA